MCKTNLLIYTFQNWFIQKNQKVSLYIHLRLPIASLSIEVKNEAGGASDSGQSVASREIILHAPHGVPAVAFGT